MKQNTIKKIFKTYLNSMESCGNAILSSYAEIGKRYTYK